jgi:hypothetical protein
VARRLESVLLCPASVRWMWPSCAVLAVDLHSQIAGMSKPVHRVLFLPLGVDIAGGDVALARFAPIDGVGRADLPPAVILAIRGGNPGLVTGPIGTKVPAAILGPMQASTSDLRPISTQPPSSGLAGPGSIASVAKH